MNKKTYYQCYPIDRVIIAHASNVSPGVNGTKYYGNVEIGIINNEGDIIDPPMLEKYNIVSATVEHGSVRIQWKEK